MVTQFVAGQKQLCGLVRSLWRRVRTDDSGKQMDERMAFAYWRSRYSSAKLLLHRFSMCNVWGAATVVAWILSRFMQ